jgi:PAS domain S-box-containing protein
MAPQRCPGQRAHRAWGAATGAPWNALQLAALVLLFAVPWAVACLLSTTPAGAPAGAAADVDTRDAVDSDGVAPVARRTGYSVTINDSQRHLAWVNDSFTRLTGYTAEEAIGRHTSELPYFQRTDPGMVARVKESFAARRGKDGRKCWLDTDAGPLLDPHAELRGWVCIQADITERVRTRDELRRSEQEISCLAYHDPLTGLANRLGSRGRLDKVLTKAAATQTRGRA